MSLSGRNGQHRRDGQPARSGLGSLFQGLGSLFDVVSEMIQDGRNETGGGGIVQAGKTQAVYGFSVKLGLGGHPVLDSFGTVRGPAGEQAPDGWREPLVDVIDEGGEWRVIAEMPGVEAGGVRVELQDGRLHLSGTAGWQTFSKDLVLPGSVEGKPAWSCCNGIVEVRLAKGGETAGHG